MHRHFYVLRLSSVLIVGLSGLPLAYAETQDPALLSDPVSIQRIGLSLWLGDCDRDTALLTLARSMEALAREDKALLRALEGAFQGALLMATDPRVYDALAPTTIEAVDNALESAFDLEAITEETDWEALIYVYGFFNRDVTVDEIIQLGERWAAMPPAERELVLPVFPHRIDAVCKPLSMGPLTNGNTAEALAAALPLLKEALLTPPQRGRAFHPPSHAALVLGPIHDRWPTDSPEGAIIRQILGSRADLITMLGNQLVGARADRESLKPFEYGFYAYSGRYIANALARMNARAAEPILAQSLEVYLKTKASASTIRYTQRALATLGNTVARTALEARLAASETHDDAYNELVWIARNGASEAVDYATTLLGTELECAPETALRKHYLSLLEGLTQAKKTE